jgi:hypothetical protein
MRLRRIFLSLAMVVVLAPAFSLGAQKTESGPTGEVTIKTTQLAAGIGFTWGDGTLKFRGKGYKFKVKGLDMIGLGVTTTSAKGDVYNLAKLSDFPGTYFAVEGGATLIKGSSSLVLKNSRGVVLNLKAEQKGVDLKLGDEGLSITPAWK